MKTKKIAILGAGESGVGAAILAKKQGYSVFVSDFGTIKQKYKDVLSQFEIPFEEKHHSESRIFNCAEIIKSPGIPDRAPVVQAACQKSIPVISEIEFASRYTTAKTICITGSNGKTTTTLLIYHILKSAGLNVGLAGNIGQSFAWQVADAQHDIYVLELSSFQLDGMFRFKADIAIILNITPDHLDRYNYDFQQYIDSKFRILNNMTADDAFIYLADDPVIQRELEKRNIQPKAYPFTLEGPPPPEGAWLNKDEITIKIKSKTLHMKLEELALQGKHNVHNSMAASVASRLIEIRKENIKQCLADFENVEHRLEHVSTIHSVEFINDSKATNVNSTWYALESMTRPVIWIAGGVDKGNDYTKLSPLVKEKVKAIICIGKENQQIHKAFQQDVEIIVDTQSMDEAVQFAYHLCEKNFAVLLSPACASFDLFNNYEERGNKFKLAVNQL